MTLPKHRNPTNSDRTASAPYNFVPLPEKVIPAVQSADELPDHDRYDKDRYTGYFDVTLTTRSSLYVRCPLTLDAFLRQERGVDEKLFKEKKISFRELIKNTPDFFYTHRLGEPVIPGSSLRGMLRSLLEVVSYGKVKPVNQTSKVFYRAVAAETDDPLREPYDQILGKYGRNVKVGYVENIDSKWYVRPAKEPAELGLPKSEGAYLKIKESSIPTSAIPGFIRFNDSKDYRLQYHPVSFDLQQRKDKRGRPYTAITNIGTPEKNYRYRGMLVCSGNMLETSDGNEKSPRSKHALVLDKDENAKTVEIPSYVVQDYRDALTQFIKDNLGEWGCLIKGQPIFYVETEGKVVAFGHSPNFRVPALQQKDKGKRAATPLTLLSLELHDTPSALDYAEAIFGYAQGSSKTSNARQGDKQLAYASRVNITDAALIGKNKNLWLSEQPFTPKILASPKPTAFQHYLTQHNPDNRKRLNHYGSPANDTTLRGHKMYWHQKNPQQQDIEEQDKENIKKKESQYTQFRPVRAGVQFQFRVYFENLSECELGALCWVLHPVGCEGKDYCHSLGMGKPLGMGAVKLEATLHLTNRAKRYASLFNGDEWESGLENSQSLSDRNVLLERTKAFEEHILSELAPEPACEHLYGLRRIAMLLKMLEWPGYPAQADGKRHLGNRPNTRYMQIERLNEKGERENEYRDRPVLPDPSAFGNLTGNSEPNLLKAQELEAQRRKEEAQRKEQEARERELDKLPPLLRELHRDGYDRSSFIGDGMRKWLERLEQATGDEERDIAQYLKDWYLKHREDQWQKPNKKNAEKIAPIKRALGES